jgi:hypothetical protein
MTSLVPEAMTEAKQKLDAKIGKMVAASTPHRFITRRLFLYDFCYVFAGNQDRGFEILNAVLVHEIECIHAPVDSVRAFQPARIPKPHGLEECIGFVW